MARINNPVKLRECGFSGPQSLFNLFFEYCIFFRWIYFKNNPRGNLLLVRAVLAVGLLGILYYSIFSSFNLILEGIDVDPVIALVFFMTLGYWNMSSVFHKKSGYCADLYKDYLKEVGEGKRESARLLGNLLSLKLLALDLWAHRSFSALFARFLEDAIFNYTDNEEDAMKLIEKVNQGKMDVGESRVLLQSHQDEIIEKSFTPPLP